MGFTDITLEDNFKGNKSLIDGIIYVKKGPATELGDKLFQ